jgi:hypothetical protein
LKVIHCPEGTVISEGHPWWVTSVLKTAKQAGQVPFKMGITVSLVDIATLSHWAKRVLLVLVDGVETDAAKGRRCKWSLHSGAEAWRCGALNEKTWARMEMWRVAVGLE